MKKFVFSVIAMMAFSVGSMANTIENISESKYDSLIENQRCYDQSLIVGMQADTAGYSDAWITWYMNAYIALCMNYTMAQIEEAGYTPYP